MREIHINVNKIVDLFIIYFKIFINPYITY